MYGQAASVIGWRPCFWIEAAFGVPVAALFLFAPALDLRGEGHELPSEPGAAALRPQTSRPAAPRAGVCRQSLRACFPTTSDRCRYLRCARLCGRRVGRQRQVMAALGRASAGGRRPAAVTAARAPRRRRRRRAPGRLVGRARVGGAAVARGPRAACASGLLGQHLGVRAGAGAAGRAHVLGPQGAPPRSARALRPRAGGSRPPPGPPRLLRARCCASLRAPPERPMSAGRRRALRSRRRERAWRSRPDARPRRRPRWTS